MQRFIFSFILVCISLCLLAQNTDLQDPISIEFRQDTMMIEQHVADILTRNQTNAGMQQAISTLEQGYDSLLNKYYQMLQNKLKEEDRDILAESQRNWIKFRDSEKSLILALSSDRYTEEVTLQSLIAAGMISDLTKDRLIDIYHYLTLGIDE